MRKLRRVTEAEVIAEFLRNEFHEPEFDPDRPMFSRVVTEPDLTSDAENALRRALLFRRRGHMWRELPPDTQWWEVALDLAGLAQVRVFPRAQWRRVSAGSFYIADIVEQLRSGRFDACERPFVEKLRRIAAAFPAGSGRSTVLLIGVDEHKPVTILEGNHRMTAAALESPARAVERFRIVCGFSPRMTENCWYLTNLPNLWRYARNRFRNLVDREADVARVLGAAARPAAAPAAALTQKAESK